MADRQTLIERLMQIVNEIGDAEQELIEADAARQHAERVLRSREDTLLLTEVTGKNAEERAAKIRVGTVTEALLLDHAERVLANRRAMLRRLNAEHSSLRAVARLLSAERG